MLAPNNNRGVTYKTDEKHEHLTNLPEYFVGLGWLMQYLTVISIVFYGVSLPIITQNIYKIRHRTS